MTDSTTSEEVGGVGTTSSEGVRAGGYDTNPQKRQRFGNLVLLQQNMRGYSDEKVREMCEMMVKERAFVTTLQETWSANINTEYENGFHFYSFNDELTTKMNRAGVGLLLSPEAVQRPGMASSNCMGTGWWVQHSDWQTAIAIFALCMCRTRGG